MTPLTAALLGCLTVLLALAPVVFLAVSPPRAMRTTCLRLACAVALEIFVGRVGAWAFASVYLRGVAVALLVVSALVCVGRSVRRPSAKRGRTAAYLAVGLSLAALDGCALSASCYSEAPLDAHLPLESGVYCVVLGGNSRLTNPFHGKAREIAALDVVELAGSGNRSTRFISSALTDYASFGAPVTSPCDGEVVHAEGALPDNPLGVPDERHPAGNHVVVRCASGFVKVAHLKYASVLAAVGAHVRSGERIGSIGNSGGTSEPHLHIGAYPPDTPLDLVVAHSGDMPIRLDGRLLVANDVFTVE